MAYNHPDMTDEVLAQEQIALQNDSALYLNCMNHKVFSQRHTEQEQRDGLILFWHVYKSIKSDQ